MRNRILGALAFCALLGVGAPADAATITLSPAFQSIAIGGPVAVDVWIDGLGAGVAPTVAAFDLDITFDPSVLSFGSVAFGADLGILGLETFFDVNLLAGPTRVDLANASLLSNATLDAIQPASFVLATLHFTAIALGISPLAITQAVLANTAGGSIASDLVGASIEVVVPEPASLALVALGLAALASRRATPRATRSFPRCPASRAGRPFASID